MNYQITISIVKFQNVNKGQDEEKPFKSCFMLINNSNRLVGGSNSLGAGVQIQ